ncbi:MAG TPA: hypothetical protein PK640_09780, partial [Verrucomicrobiota bacterium]|nr:hypothetical protein [Verrucomicrobiota bacterium]
MNTKGARLPCIEKELADAQTQSYDALRRAHIADLASLIDRVALDIGATPSDVLGLPTDARLKRVPTQPHHPITDIGMRPGRNGLGQVTRPVTQIRPDARLRRLGNRSGCSRLQHGLRLGQRFTPTQAPHGSQPHFPQNRI